MRTQSMKEASRRLGRNPSYFYYMKQNNLPFFNLVEQLGDGDLIKGYEMYIDITEDLIDQFLPLYNTLDENLKVLAFSKEFGCSNHKLRAMSDTLGNGSKVSYKRYLGMEALIPAMESFIKENI